MWSSNICETGLIGGIPLPSVYLRTRETHDGHYVVAMCDEDLLGKTLIEGNIKFKVPPEFYGEALVNVKVCV
ncbi:MAG: DUF424 family protein, partial [Candidatus Thorarchaeota archaeon]